VFANPMKAFLDQQFPGKWIAREGPTAWPPRSQDFSPLDLFLWGYIKDLVHQTKMQTLDGLHGQTAATCETVTPLTLQITWREVECRADICWATKGKHVEIY
jgi:hypothetical protein